MEDDESGFARTGAAVASSCSNKSPRIQIRRTGVNNICGRFEPLDTMLLFGPNYDSSQSASWRFSTLRGLRSIPARHTISGSRSGRKDTFPVVAH